MLLEDKIIKDTYDEKCDDITRKIKQEREERSLYVSNVNAQKDVKKIMVGETNADGSSNPYKLTLVLRGIDNRMVPGAKNRYLNLRKKTE